MTDDAVGVGTDNAGPSPGRLRFVFGRVFGNRSLRHLELALAGFNATEWGTWIAVLVYAYEQGGTTEAGLVAAGLTIPAALFAPFGATLADRRRAGRVLFASYAVQTAAFVAIAAALAADATPLLVYLGMALANTALTVARPATNALTPTLARTPEELTAINVATSWTESVTLLVAPVATGVLLATSGFTALFLAAAATIAASAWLVWSVPGPPAAGTAIDAEPVLSALAGAFRVVRHHKVTRFLGVLLAADFVALGALDVLYPELAVGVLERDGSWAGYLNAAFGAGATVGVVATARLVGRARLMPAMLAGLAVYFVSFCVLAAYATIGSAMLMLALAGAGRVVLDVGARTLLQRVAPADVLARVFGLLEALYMVGLCVGSLAVAALVAVGGAELALLGIGLLLPVAVGAFGRQLLDIDRHATVPVVEIGLLRSLPLFSPLPPDQLEAVARALDRIDITAATTVITQGEEGDRFYVIADGVVEVLRDGQSLGTLGRGDAFGEIALLHAVPRTATCRTTGPATLYSLAKPDFLLAVTGSPTAMNEAERLATDREHSAAAMIR